jgi:anion-transporting  ArsA/GET3 family ATPase
MKKMPIVGLIPQVEEFIDTTFTADSIPLALKNAIFFQKILDAEDLAQEIQFDIIVADFPPTGNMVALFEIPEDQVKVTLKYSIEFYNSIKGAVKNVSKMFRKMFNPFGDDKERRDLAEEIVQMFEDLEQRGERITQLINDIGSLRLVSITEKPSFEEIKRARDLTERFINLDGVHVNMLIPKEAAKTCDFCKSMRETQQRYLGDIQQEFHQVAVWESNRLKEEPIGIEGLRKLAREVYKDDTTPNDLLYPSKK